jgi:hypothetical protein
MAISYASDIRPLFTQSDIENMAFFCDLANYEDVKTYAEDILDRLKGTSGPVMPPESSGGPWPIDNINKFAKWITDGCQP